MHPTSSITVLGLHHELRKHVREYGSQPFRLIRPLGGVRVRKPEHEFLVRRGKHVVPRVEGQDGRLPLLVEHAHRVENPVLDRKSVV